MPLLAGGCGGIRRVLGIGGTEPPRYIYGLAQPDSMRAAEPRGTDGQRAPALEGSLAIASYVTPGIYGERGIVYRRNETEYAVYQNREWKMDLGDHLALFTQNILWNRPLTAEPAIYDPPSRRAQTYLWRATVREFEEVDRPQGVFVAVRLDAALIRVANDSIVWSGTARAERQVGPPRLADMNLVVQGLSEVAGEVITELVKQAEGSVGRGAAVRAQSRP